MKKLFALLAILSVALLLSACNGNNKENDTVRYETGVFIDKNWDDTVGTYKGPAVPDKETALKIGTAVFDAMEKSEESRDLTPESVFFDEEDHIWIVTFGKAPEGNVRVLGGGCSIAIREDNGEVVRIWFGE